MINTVAKLLEDSARHFGIDTIDSSPMSTAVKQLIEQARSSSSRIAHTENASSQLPFMNKNYTSGNCSEGLSIHR